MRTDTASIGSRALTLREHPTQGLRVSEIVALKWEDFDFQELTLMVQRSIVHGRVGDVKTEYSRDSVPRIQLWSKP